MYNVQKAYRIVHWYKCPAAIIRIHKGKKRETREIGGGWTMCHSLDTSIAGLDLAIQHFGWKGGVAEEKFQFCGNRTLFQWALNFLLKRLNRFKNRGKEAQLSFINFTPSWQFSKSPKVKLAQLSHFLMLLFSFLWFPNFLFFLTTSEKKWAAKKQKCFSSTLIAPYHSLMNTVWENYQHLNSVADFLQMRRSLQNRSHLRLGWFSLLYFSSCQVRLIEWAKHFQPDLFLRTVDLLLGFRFSSTAASPLFNISWKHLAKR